MKDLKDVHESDSSHDRRPQPDAVRQGAKFKLSVASIITHCLTVSALVLALVTECHVRTLSTSVDKNLQNAVDVQKSVSTRFLGFFPEYMGEVIRLAQSTETTLVVASDHLAYGSFSSHVQCLEYLEQLQTVARNIDTAGLHVLNYDTALSIQDGLEQFTPGDYFQLKDRECFKTFLERINDTTTRRVISESKDARPFLEELLIQERPYVDILKKYRRETHSRLTYNCWIRDGKEAIFAVKFKTPGSLGTREIGFYTQDTRLVEMLRKFFTDAWTASA